MMQSLILCLPDRPDALRWIHTTVSASGCRVVRLDYDDTVDARVLFLDVDGAPGELSAVETALAEAGCVASLDDAPRGILLRVSQVRGGLPALLTLMERHGLVPSILRVHPDGDAPLPTCLLGLSSDSPEALQAFLQDAGTVGRVESVDAHCDARPMGGMGQYTALYRRLRRQMALSDAQTRCALVQVNRMARILSGRQEPPFKLFAYVNAYADMLSGYSGAGFVPRVRRFSLSDGFRLTAIEPPVGGNVFILHKDSRLLFIDCGYACFAAEMQTLLEDLFPGFQGMERQLMLTHPDLDHCGAMHAFDTVYVTRECEEHLRLEAEGAPNFREQNPLQAPYIALTRLLTRSRPPRMETLRTVEGGPKSGEPVCLAGSVHFCGRRLDVYRGNGGHAVGECAIVDERDRLVFSGDIVVNAQGCLPSQTSFNRLAPYLMTRVNLDSRKAIQERLRLKQLFPPVRYRYCCGHGALLQPPDDPLTALPL